MKLKNLIATIFVATTLSLCVNAQAKRGAGAAAGAQPSKAVVEKTDAGAFDQKHFDALRGEGFEALYNLDYEGARRRFREMTKAFPDHPAGYQFLAASLWLKTLNESRRLQASLYNDEGFYKEKDDRADPAVTAEFRELTQKTKELCETRLRSNPKDTDALYYLGAVEGLKAAWGSMVERSFMSALSNGKDSVDHHRDLLKIDPNYTDAKVTVGMYDYVVGTLPPLVKLGATFIGFRGSKKRGLATLEQVAHEGRWARDDAKSLLIALLKREHRFRDAYNYASELATKYPRNYLFKMEAADALVSQAEVDRATDPEAAKKTEAEAFAVFDSLLAPARGPNAPHTPLDLVHYNYGDALLVAGQAERAAKELNAAATTPGAEASMVTRARLRAAQALDIAGKREEALTQYKAVLARPNVYDSHEDAKRGLKEPYKLTRKVSENASEGDDSTNAKTHETN
jgi:tetratricopeptide (TPR) repeat protein